MFVVKIYSEEAVYGPFTSIAKAARWAEARYGPGFNHNWWVSEVRKPDG